MKERIGNVVLDLDFYPGEDLYCDGAIEDEILEFVKEHDVKEYGEYIASQKNWPIFYHLSPYRANIIDWLPFRKTDKVLEIGSGCGAITGAIASKVGSVTCIDLSKKRSMINAYRNKERDNITIMVGNFQDIEPHLDCDYDYVLLVGVFEYGQSYIGGENPYEDFMRICNRHRNPKGRMIIAIENKFGLKYWAGCKEDHLGTYFSGLEGYHEGGAARTFTRKGLEKIMNNVGITHYSFYYPYPDYKFMHTIYSDRYLPKKGELSTNIRNFDRNRMILFDEKQVFDQIIEEEEFPLFSNSYLVVVGIIPELVYSKFSNDRDKSLAIRTSIYQNVFGEYKVEKVPQTPEAVAHINRTAKAYELLSKRYEKTKVIIDPCIKKDNVLKFAYCKGQTLEHLLDECISNGDMAGFRKLVDEYMYWLNYNSDMNVSNLDFIFPNIIVNGKVWQVIDYEWTYEKKISPRDIAFRAFYNYLLGGEVRQICKDVLYKEILKLTEEEISLDINEERELQHYVNGDRATVSDMREIIGYRAYDAREMEKSFVANDDKFMAQVYMDQGAGFSEANSKFIKYCYKDDRNMSFEFTVPEGTKRLRIDPCNYCCYVTLRKIEMDGFAYGKKDIIANGGWIDDNSVIFASADPNLEISCEGKTKLSVELEVLELSQAAAEKFMPKRGFRKFF